MIFFEPRPGSPGRIGTGKVLAIAQLAKLHALGWSHSVKIQDGVQRLYDWYRASLA